MTSPEAGWYTDDAGATRWWDGYRWHDPQPASPAAGVAEAVAPAAAPGAVEAADPGPAPRRRIPVVALVVAGVLVLAALVVGAWAVARSGGHDGPQGAVERLVGAVKGGDCDALEAVTTPQYRQDSHLDCAALAEAHDYFSSHGGDFTVRGVEQLSEVSAEVTVEITLDDVPLESETTVFTVAREGGRWVVIGDSD